MNVQQIQYVLAVAELRHFERAAEKCFVTQSTLSTMISRFEDELGIQIFDRKKKPVALTTEGATLLEQLKKINKEIEQLKELGQEIKGEVRGNLTISVIPTIAPFLLPLFLQDFAAKFPNLNIVVKEQTTAEIMRQLKSRDLDIGIISIPVKDEDIEEIKLYDEPFLYYDAGHELKQTVSPESLETTNLCLLEEGHCMRTQVINLCDLHKTNLKNLLNFDYKAGSIDSLLRFVKVNGATTLLPYLATTEFTKTERKHLSSFSDPIPFRSVGLVVHRHFVKDQILEKLKVEVLDKVAPLLPKRELKGEELLPV
ncbi:MAG: LysR substrate-binding domain-containing protein [Vicingaceae bacterium]